MPIGARKGLAGQFVHGQGGGDVQQHQARHMGRVVQRQTVRHARTPVVGQHGKTFVPQALHQSQQLVRHDPFAVGLMGRVGRKTRAAAVAAQIDHDQREMLRQLVGHAVPHRLGLRVAVQQQQCRAAAALARKKRCASKNLKSFEHGLILRAARHALQDTIWHLTHALNAAMQIHRADLDLLLNIVDEGSLAGAARQLDLAPTVVSKRLSALEAQVGTRLLHRTTRRLQLTAEGELFVAQARPLCDGFERLESSLSERRDEAHGTLRVASSFGFGRIWLAPALAALQRQHPGISVQLHLTEQLPDMTSGRFDAAVWLWRPSVPSLVTRRLASNRRVVVAAPGYLKQRGTPATPNDLAEHACVLVRENDDSPTMWRLQPLRVAGVRGVHSTRAVQAVRVHGALSSNHGEVVRDWAVQGHGLMLRSWWDVHALVARGALVHVLPDWAQLDADVHLVLPPRDLRLATPRRLQLLQTFLVAAFAQVPWAQPLKADVKARLSAAGSAGASPAKRPAPSAQGRPKPAR